MIQDMTKNYRLLRRVHHDMYTTIAENFQYYLSTLKQSEFDEIDSDIIRSALNSLQNVETATELLMLFDFFYFVIGRFPTTGVHTFIQRADSPMEVNSEELNIKKLYEKFRTTNSYALVSSQFLAALNIFLGDDPELSRRFLREFYQNMTVSTLSTDYAFNFDAFTNLSTSINLPLRRQRNESISRIKLEDDNTDLKLKTKYEFDDNDPLPTYPFDTTEDNLNTGLENIEEKVKQVDIVEPKLEKPTEIEQSDNNRKSDNDWLNEFLAAVETTKQTLQELNDQAIAAVLSDKIDVPQIDTQIDTIFIDDNELFGKDELTDENKAFIKTLLDKANYKDILDDIKDDQQKLIQEDLSIPIPPGDIKTEVIDDVVPPDPLFFPTENEIFEIEDVIPLTVPNLMPPQKTAAKSVDDKNDVDYLKMLQIYRSDLFIDEEDNNNNYVILTPKIEIIDDVVPPDIFTPKTEFISDLTPPQKTGIKSVDYKNYEDIPTPKTEIIEIEDVVPPLPPKPIPVIPQETVKLPKPIPKTDLPENIDIISAISDINKIISPNQFDNADGDNNIVGQQISDDE